MAMPVCSHKPGSEVSPFFNILIVLSLPTTQTQEDRPETLDQTSALANLTRTDRVKFAMPREHSLLGVFPEETSFA